jgi:hypothetical protein
MKTLHLVLLVSLGFYSAAAWAQEVRKDARKNPAVVEKYREVVKRMRELSASNPNDPRGWLYQSGVHAHIPPASVTKQVFASIGLSVTDAQITEMKKYALEPPLHSVQNGTWDQCHRSNPDTVFLAWHRVYVMYFEQIARELLSDPTFALPYWAYNQGGEAASLPKEFRSPTYKPDANAAPILNPLHAPRETAVNEGAALVDDAMTLSGLGEFEFPEFQSSIEIDPHNFVHGVIGDRETTLLMALPNWAAQDPIFWLHHTNIDRIWAAWEKVHKTPEDLGGNEKYVFVKGDGSLVTHTGKELYKLAREITYTYDTLDDIPVPTNQPGGPHLTHANKAVDAASALPAADKNAASAKVTLADSASSDVATGVVLGPERKTLKLNVGPLVRSAIESTKVLAQDAVPLSAFATKPQIGLVLENITGKKLVNEPFVVQVKKEGQPAVTIGTFTFFTPIEGFAAEKTPVPGHPGHDAPGHSAKILKVKLDLNVALRELNITSTEQLEKLEVSIVPYSTLQNEKRGRPDKKAVIPAESVEVGTIRLETTVRRLPSEH